MPNRSILEIGMIYTLHEMKNPLTSIILSVDALESGEVEDPAASYETIKKHAMQLKSAISQLCSCYEEHLHDSLHHVKSNVERPETSE